MNIPSLREFPRVSSIPTSHLPRSLSSLETWGFGLTGLLLWLGAAPGMQAELGAQAIWVWLPGVVIGVIINLQVKHLGSLWPDLSGGTPNYITRLLPDAPFLSTYVALGYFISWVAVLPVNAIILTALIESNLAPLGLYCPRVILEIGFTVIAFFVAFSGTRALGILHLVFVVPAVALLLWFCVQGGGWLLISPASPGVMPSDWSTFDGMKWAKWYIIAAYAVYACETSSAFVADSRQPKKTLRILPIAAGLIPVVYLVGSWVLMRLAPLSSLTPNKFTTNPFEQLLIATPFWGQFAPFLVTFLIASGALLSCATAVSNCPRILYQLSLDGYLPSIFSVTSRSGVLGPSLVLTLFLSLLCLGWGDVHRIVMVTGVGWLLSFVVFHWGLWQQREESDVLYPWWSLGFAILEAIALVVGGIAWGWHDLLIGLALPVLIGIGCYLIPQIPLAPFQAESWRSHAKMSVKEGRDFVAIQVSGLITLICGAIAISWGIRSMIDGAPDVISGNLLVVVILSVAFVGVAIACWTTLPQVSAMAEARERAEGFFNLAVDSILVLDEYGAIRRANAATESLFGLPMSDVIGHPLSRFLVGLSDIPEEWSQRSERAVHQPTASPRVVEVTISSRLASSISLVSPEAGKYVAVLRDITERKIAEEDLQKSEQQLRDKASELEHLLGELTHTQGQLIQAEKMSSLGQLVAGVAHEINNPVNFINGNLHHAHRYIEDLLILIELYQASYPDTPTVIEDKAQEIDLEFMQADLPKLLRSMQVGADRILDIIRSLRSFSRHDEADVKETDIHAGLDSTLMILRNRLKAKPKCPDIQVIRDYGEIPMIECYPGQLNQVFMNLLSNAIDAVEDRVMQEPVSDRPNSADQGVTNDPPTIWIQTQVTLTDRLIIRITDNGLGIPESSRSRLFDPFFTTKPVGKGTGLGLAISYQIIVERHHGMLTCHSTIGRGTEFVVELPTRQTLSQLHSVNASAL
ncbi:MAG: ATP-binding protein [Elainellaceae cyanobacterium]